MRNIVAEFASTQVIEGAEVESVKQKLDEVFGVLRTLSHRVQQEQQQQQPGQPAKSGRKRPSSAPPSPPPDKDGDLDMRNGTFRCSSKKTNQEFHRGPPVPPLPQAGSAAPA